MKRILHAIEPHHIIRLIATLLFTMGIAVAWDAWWHGAVGRDSFWEPPHLLLYSVTFFIIAFGVYGWYVTREKVWKQYAFVLSLIPLSAPFDELWHRSFGIEALSSPLIVWSPPHLVIISAIGASVIMTLRLLRSDRDKHIHQLFGSMLFATLASLVVFLLALPIEPTGPWHLAGFWGAGIIAFGLMGVLLSAARMLPGKGSATAVIAFLMLLGTIGHTTGMPVQIQVAPHDHPPMWLLIFSFLITAAYIDLFKSHGPLVKGAFAGLMWAVILYGFAYRFFEPEFQYSVQEALVAIFAAIIGGSIAGIMEQKVNRQR